MNRRIDAFDYASHICKAISPGGVLLTTAVDGKVNTMTIGWGSLGVEWRKPIFIVYVRQSRFTRKMLEKCNEFTINVPYGAVDKKILGYCGTKSGRDTDKIKDLGLHLVDSEIVSVPGIRELPLTLECKVIYRSEQNISDLPDDVQQRYYADGDHHYVFYGEIVNAYLIEE